MPDELDESETYTPSLGEEFAPSTRSGETGQGLVEASVANPLETTAGATERSSGSYGPIRHQRNHGAEGTHHHSTALQEALHRSTEFLDIGSTRVARTPYSPPPGSNAEATSEVTISVPEPTDAFESFLVHQEGHKRDSELRDRQIEEHEWEQVIQGKRKEFDKLIKTGAIRIHTGREAQQIMQSVPKERFIDSRFVKTRRASPDNPGQTEIKCRWVLKGFQDPDILELQRQSPTLSADSLMVTLQLIASLKWELMIMDIEGAFLQGEPLQRKQGKIYAKIPKEGIPGVGEDSVIELCKCVYGLMDAPRKWWESITSTLVSLGMKQSNLDPCTFFWHGNGKEHERHLQGGCVSSC